MADLKLRFLIEALDKGAKSMMGGLAKAAGGVGVAAKGATTPVGKLAAAADKAGDQAETGGKKLVNFSAGAKLTQTAASQAWKPVQKLGEAEEKAGHQADKAGDQHEHAAKQMKGAGTLAIAAGTALGGAIGALVAGAAGLAASVPGYILATSKRIASIRREADALHLTTEQYQRLAYTLEANEIPTEKLGDMLQTLADKQLDSLRGNKNAALAFKLVGVAVKESHNRLKPTPLLLGQVADGFKKLSAARQDFVAKQLGAGSAQDLKSILALGSKGIVASGDEGARKGLVISGADIAKAQALTKASEDFNRSIKGFTQTLVLAAGPTLTKLVLAADHWVELNKGKVADGIVKGIEKIAAVDWPGLGNSLARIAGSVERIVSAYDRMASGGKLNWFENHTGIEKFTREKVLYPAFDFLFPDTSKGGQGSTRAAPTQPKPQAVDVNIKVDQGRIQAVTATSPDSTVAATVWRGLITPW